jgi:MFS family permease
MFQFRDLSNQMEEPFLEENELNEDLFYTYDEALDHIGFGFFQMILMNICAMGFMLDGIEIFLVSIIIPELVSYWQLTPLQAGVLGSISSIGMAFGSLFGGMLSDLFGRKFIFISSISIVTTFGFLAALSPGYVYFLIFRFFCGIGLGAGVPIGNLHFL